MEKEKSNIQNLSVCYCLMKRESSNQTGTVRMSPMTEMLNHVQAFYENKGAAVYSQAFVYGNQNAFARAFEQYPFGFRAGLDENVEKYDLTEMLVLCCGLLEDYLPGSEAVSYTHLDTPVLSPIFHPYPIQRLSPDQTDNCRL